MKLSNRKIVNVINGIGPIATMSMPVKASYAISKNIIKLEKEAEIYNIEREKLLDKYAEKDEEGKLITEGGNINIKAECITDWNRDITELLNIEVEVDVHTFNVEHLINCNMSVEEIKLIDFMIEE